MAENINYLFQYLKKENIKIDNSEFEFQLQSHNNYPNLLSVSDTLTFFNINNGAIKVNFEDLEFLPNNFIALLNDDHGVKRLSHIEKINNDYFITIGNKTSKIPTYDLEKHWSGIILLAEKTDNEISEKSNNNLSWLMLGLVLFFFLMIFKEINLTNGVKFFAIFPMIGILFSVAALKDLFNSKNELLDKFCNLTTSTNCSSIVGSSKWKIFETINFSDLSILFFSTQFLAYLFLSYSSNIETYFSIQKILLISSIPILVLSLYYQKFIEKKWCPICLVIILIIISEIFYIFYVKISFSISDKLSLFTFGLIFTSLFIFWSSLKKTLSNQKKLREFHLKGTRFIRNYEVFKKNLLSSNVLSYQPLSSGNLILGNKNANLKITLITNPFCKYCENAHKLIENILKNHSEKISIDFRFNFNAVHGDEKYTEVHQNLIRIYFDQGEEHFLDKLSHWFENKDESKLKTSNKNIISDMRINQILENQYEMNQLNKISFTPALIINQYLYPQIYDINDLYFFINDLIEDEI